MRLAWPWIELNEAVIIVVPTPTPTATPRLLMVATLVSDEFHWT